VWALKGPAVLSRARDGRFCRPWPVGMDRPASLAREDVIPGVLHVDGPDLRPYAVRGA
jgi:hypothetical protein